jgi:hypothetical protein
MTKGLPGGLPGQKELVPKRRTVRSLLLLARSSRSGASTPDAVLIEVVEGARLQEKKGTKSNVVYQDQTGIPAKRGAIIDLHVRRHSHSCHRGQAQRWKVHPLQSDYGETARNRRR